jgi:phage host-nuclease inhibitor protein Gam
MRKGTDYHSMEIMILHDDTTAYMNTYSEMFTNASLATLTVDISGGNVRLRITPVSVGSLEMNIERKLFSAI